ncbi:MAG: helix-hairpin-helix domain-containing protein [Actinomycetota bacterium]|nr:helix-hairpin-helix domain-containing protein [Actinomycetota bacterium]
MGLSLATLVFATLHALAIRRRYLERIGGLRASRLDAAERELEERRQALEIVRDDPLRARELGIGRSGEPGAYDGHLVDLNHASEAAIAALPRIGPEVAARAVAVRDEIEGFESLEDAGHLLDLPPATVERLRELAVCLPY